MTHNIFITIMDHRCVMTLYMLTIVNVLHSAPVFLLSTRQIQIIRIRSQAECKTMWILSLDLHSFSSLARQGLRAIFLTISIYIPVDIAH